MDGFMEFERAVLLFVQEALRHDVMTPFWVTITHLGDSGWIWILTSLILLSMKRTRKVGFVALCSLGVCFIINNLLLKNLVARPRPYTQIPELKILVDQLRDYSFPSGHTCASFAAACTFRRMLPKKWGRLALVLAFLIGLSRLYVGVHYLSDVIVGGIIGTLGSLVIYKLYRRYDPIVDKTTYYWS